MECVRGQGIQLLRQARQFVRSVTRERYVDGAIRDVPDWRHVDPEEDELAPGRKSLSASGR